jgi:hypothetical protein
MNWKRGVVMVYATLWLLFALFGVAVVNAANDGSTSLVLLWGLWVAVCVVLPGLLLWTLRWIVARFERARTRDSEAEAAPHGGGASATSSGGRNLLWPSVSDARGAQFAVGEAFWAAVICCVLTAIVAELAIFSPGVAKTTRVNGSSLLDAGLFLLVAIGLRRRWRGAAWAGLGLYVFEALWRFSSGRAYTNVIGWMVTALFTLAFVNGVRGAHAWSRALARETQHS